MAVQIPISANAASAVSALRDIEAAIAKAGQTGRDFSKLDLSHPELSGMAQEIRLVQQRFLDLARIGRGATATAFRGVLGAGGAAGPLAWQATLPNVFTSPQQMAAHQAAVGNYLFQGTRWQPPPPAVGGGGGGGGGGGPPGQGPAGGGGGGGGGGGMLAGIGSSMMGFMGASLALAGINTVKQVLSESISKAQDEAGTSDDLYRRTDTTQSFLDLRDAVMASTKALGVNAQEAGRLSVMWARVTGDTDPGSITSNVRMGVGFGRSFGMDPGTATSGMAQANVLGLDSRTFAVLVGEAAGKGGRSADETMPALLRLAEASTRALVTHSNLVESASMLAGMNAMNIPGLRGVAGEAIINQLGNSLTNPGAGPAGQAFTYMAGQRQQGVSDPYRQEFLRQGGLFASPASEGMGSSTVSNFEAQRQEIMRQFPGSDLDSRLRRANAMQNLTGLNMRQVMAMERFKPADMNTTAGALKHAGLGLEQLNETAIGDAVRIANAPDTDQETEVDPATGRKTTRVGLGTLRQQMLGRHGQGALSAEDQTRLSGAGPKELRDVMLQMAAKYGQSETDGSKTRDATAELSNAMTKLGRDLLPPLNDLKDGVGKLGGELADLGSILTDVYRAGKGDPEASDRLVYGKGPDGQRRARGDRNNNPLNLTGPGDAGLDAEFGKYSTPEAGIAAAARQLVINQDVHHLNTLRQQITRWAPPKDASGRVINDTESYIKQVAGETGIDPDKPIDMHDPAIAARVINGMSHREVGHPIDPGMIDRGVARGLGGGAAATSHSVNIAPLEVYHLDPEGTVLFREQLPLTAIAPPTPSGMNAPGGTGMLPPPAQMSREDDAFYMSRGRSQSPALDLNLTPPPPSSRMKNLGRPSNDAFRDNPKYLPESIPTQMPADKDGVMNYTGPFESTGLRT